MNEYCDILYWKIYFDVLVERVGFEPWDLVNTGSAVLPPRPPGQPADISVRTILKLHFSCAIRSSLGAHAVAWSSLLLSVQLLHFSSDPVFFSDSKGFWPWCMTLGVTGFLDFGHQLEFWLLENTMFPVRGRRKNEIPFLKHIVSSSIQSSRRYPKSRNPVTPTSVIHHGQKPSECKKQTGSLEMLELVVARAREQVVKPPQSSL
jgi:hypothetical protein